MAERKPPEGFSFQAFQFALDTTEAQEQMFFRFSGARRKAHNWAVAQFKANIRAYKLACMESPYPSYYTMRKKWNAAKPGVCVNEETGAEWWSDISSRVFYGGIEDACDAYARWSRSRRGEIAGKRVGFPRFKKRGRDRDRFSCGQEAKLDGRRHLRLPKIGKVRLHENTRRLERLLTSGRARILSTTVSRRGRRWIASFQVEIMRPQRHHRPSAPDSRVGVDLGVRRLATVARPDGEIIERVPNPRALNDNLKQLRRLCKDRSRCTRGSRRWKERNAKISDLHARIANIRKHHIHTLTTRLAKTHGQIVTEDLNVAGMLTQKGLIGARSRRRGVSDAAMGEVLRQIGYKAEWYGSERIVADRWYPSSKTCSGCGHVQVIGWAERWACSGCGSIHNRDDNAAINLARWSPREENMLAATPSYEGRPVSPVGAAVKRGAASKTATSAAGGCEARKPAIAGNPARGAA